MPAINIRGNSLFYVSDPARLSPEAVTVIFIHGSGNSTERWRRQFPVSRTLPNAAGVQLVAIDLPGHARSQGRGCDTVEGYVQVINEFVQSLGLTKAVLAGNSLGGAIALSAALSGYSWLKGLILVGTGAKLRVAPAIIDELMADRFPELIISYAYSPTTPQSLIDEAEKDVVSTTNRVRLNDFGACDKFDIRDRLQEITAPCLIIVGADDKLTPVKYSEYLRDNLTHSSLIIVPDAGHMVMYEQPDEFNKALDVFLGKL